MPSRSETFSRTLRIPTLPGRLVRLVRWPTRLDPRRIRRRLKQTCFGTRLFATVVQHTMWVGVDVCSLVAGLPNQTRRPISGWPNVPYSVGHAYGRNRLETGK